MGRVAFDLDGPITNRYEVMSYAAQPRSTALGKTAGVGRFSNVLDLQTIWPSDVENQSSPYGAHKWHSAEFRSNLMEEQGYWRTLLYTPDGFNLPNP